MDAEKLSLFCGTDPWHVPYAYCSPFVRAKYRYATDGSICVRVPTDEPDTEETKDRKFPNAPGLFDRFTVDGDWLPWPEPLYREGWEKCRNCDGYGKTDSGKKCRRCQHTGTVLMPVIEVSGRPISFRYDRLIRKALPQPVEYGIPRSNILLPPLRLRFEGGEGMVMPVLRHIPEYAAEAPLRV